MKRKTVKWIGLGAAALAVFAILGIVFSILGRAVKDSEYTYEATAEKLPEYDADLFQIDGKLDEKIYDELRWWEEIYSEGEEQDPVKVRTTSYMGENGVYFIFDVDDDKVYVDMKRSSYNNSSMTVYVAAEGTHNLNDNVWEIDILPNEFISAKRYLGGYYYAAVKAKGWKSQPFVRAATKGGAINTPECKGYVMESYFPYEFLFDGEEDPEQMSLNFSLQRSYSLESESRDVYYNFGQHVMSNWSWGDPGTWWTFHQKGLDSVDLILEAGQGGALEHRNDYIARYQTEKVKIVPDEGYRIANLIMESNGETKDVTDQITWEEGVNYFKIRNATDRVKLIAAFEKIPGEKGTLTGTVTWNGKALSGKVLEDVSLRFISGGVAYETELSEGGTYGLEVPTGKGILEVISKNYQYVAQRIAIDVTHSKTITNIKLTSNDYGNSRVMELPAEQVMGNKEILFNGKKMTGSMSKTFSYDFTLKYNGQLLEKDGVPVADPTFGEYDHQYTSINVNGTFTDAEGKALANSNMNLQIMSWDGNGMWMAKMWLDGQTVTARLGIDELQAFVSDVGVHFRLIFENSKLGLYMIRDNNTFKVTELEAKSTADRYLKTIDFSAEHCINHSVWYIEDQTLALSRTHSSYDVTAKVANGDGVVEFKKNPNGSTPRLATNWDGSDFNGAFGWTGKLRVPGVLKNGKIQYHKMTTGYWVDTSKNKEAWYQYTVYLIGDGNSYYVTKNNKKAKLQLNAEQIKLLGTTGLQMGAFAQGKEISYFVDNGKGEMVVFADLYDFNENNAWFPWPNQYGGAYLLHEGGASIGEVISTGAEFYTCLSKDMDVKGFVTDVLRGKYQNNQALNPVTKTFGPDQKNYFVMNHRDIKENAFYGYNIRLNELKDAFIYINTKAWSEKYYSNYVKLRITEDSAYFVWQQGVSPYQSSKAVYFLNKAQLAKFTNGGLDVFIEYKEHSPEMNLYVDDGYGNIVLASTYTEGLFGKSTGITYVKNLIGYSVEVNEPETNVTVTATGCVTAEKADFISNVKELYNKNIVRKESAANLIKIDSRKIENASGKINLDYLAANIGGSWFDRFNVKLPDGVTKNGKILTDAVVKLNARLQGDQYYGQNLYLHLEKNGIGYLEFINYGGNWESYYYRLTEKQLAQLASGTGLNLFVGHKDNENQITLYIADDLQLIPLKSFVYGETELLAKGYYASYEGEKNNRVKTTVDCYKYEGSLTDALKQAYNTSYTISDKAAAISRSVHIVSSAADKVNLDYGNETLSGTWLDHFNVKLDGAVNAEGEILKYATAKLMARLQGNQYFGQSMNLRLTESGAYLEMPNYGIEDGDWKTYVYPLNAAQLKQLTSKDGMDLYLSCAADNKVTVYLSEGTNLIAVKEFTYGSQALRAKGYRVSYDGAEDDSVLIMAECVPYSGTFEAAVKDIYNYDVANSVSNEVYNYDYVVKENNFSKEFTEAGQKLEVYTHLWNDYFYQVNIKNAGVDQDGNVTAASKMKIQHNAMDGSNAYKGQTAIELNLNTDGSSIKFTQGSGAWPTETFSLTTAQLKAIGSEEGLNLYILHDSSNADTFVVYMQLGDRLLEMFTSKISGANHGELCQVTFSNLTEKATVSGGAYNYADTDFVTAVRTVYGKDSTVCNRVDVSIESIGAAVKGIKDIYHVGDTVSFTVQVSDGYTLKAVTINGTALTANKDGKYQFDLTEDHLTACAVEITTNSDDKALRSFASLAGQGNTGDFGPKQFDGKKINQLMGTNGYSYLFHTKLQSTDSPAAKITYTGWGSMQETYYVQVQKDGDVWNLYLRYYNKNSKTKEIAKVALSEAQLAKITGNGLNLFLVNSNATTYSLYIENDSSTDVVLVGEFTSVVSNKQIYMIGHDVAGLTTNGYFYKGYTPKEAMREFISDSAVVSLAGLSKIGDFTNSYLFHIKSLAASPLQKIMQKIFLAS